MSMIAVPDLENKISVPTKQLLGKSASPIVNNLGQTYYGDFYRCITDSEDGREKFKCRLLSSSAEAHVKFRARCISVAAALGISYEEARSVAIFSDLQPTQDEAADIVIDNYLKMAAVESPHPVFARIDEYGRIIVVEGFHRTVINFANDFDTTPVFVLQRHSEWTSFLDFFHRQGESLYQCPLALYHQIDHPDFSNFAIKRQDRSRPILDYLSRTEARRGVDIGSMIGFYSHSLARAGYQVTAIEYDTEYAEAAKRLCVLYDLPVQVINSDLFDVSVGNNQYDFAVLLSIVYHLIRRDEVKCRAYLDDLKEKIPLFFVDTEVRTGLLPENKLRALFKGFQFELLFVGNDERKIFAICK